MEVRRLINAMDREEDPTKDKIVIRSIRSCYQMTRNQIKTYGEMAILPKPRPLDNLKESRISHHGGKER